MEKEKPLYRDNFEDSRNIGRALLLFIYGLSLYYALTDFSYFSASMDKLTGRPLGHYIMFLVPLAGSLHSLYFFQLEKKTGIPLYPLSRWLMYGVLVVSMAYYLSLIISYFHAS